MTMGFRILLCVMSCGWFLRSEIIDRIAISVGNQVITERQVEEDLRLTAFLNQDHVNLDAATKKQAAGRLIEQALVRREMELSHYPAPPASDTDEALKSVKARFATAAEYEQALKSYGIDEEALKERLSWQATFLRFIEYRFRPGVQIPDADVQAYYQKELDKWKQQGVNPLPALDDVRGGIEQTLTEQRVDQELDRWLAETRTQVAVRFHDEALQ
jgi:hypothetical protein